MLSTILKGFLWDMGISMAFDQIKANFTTTPIRNEWDDLDDWLEVDGDEEMVEYVHYVMMTRGMDNPNDMGLYEDIMDRKEHIGSVVVMGEN